jgi:hypothetical protein
MGHEMSAQEWTPQIRDAAEEAAALEGFVANEHKPYHPSEHKPLYQSGEHKPYEPGEHKPYLPNEHKPYHPEGPVERDAEAATAALGHWV